MKNYKVNKFLIYFLDIKQERQGQSLGLVFEESDDLPKVAFLIFKHSGLINEDARLKDFL